MTNARLPEWNDLPDDARVGAREIVEGFLDDDTWAGQCALDVYNRIRDATTPTRSAGVAGGVPAGWKLVPAEPTEVMLQAGEETALSSYTGTPVVTPGGAWAAMLAAAPEPPAPGGDAGAEIERLVDQLVNRAEWAGQMLGTYGERNVEKCDDFVARDREALLTAIRTALACPAADHPDEADVRRMQFALERDRSIVAMGLETLGKVIEGRAWLREAGRGSYAFNDDCYQQEFGGALDEIEAAIAPLRKVAQDWTDCSKDAGLIRAARETHHPDETADVREDDVWNAAIEEAARIVLAPDEWLRG